jgi:hypothetical protein
MARPLEFELVVRCKDPEAEYRKLLSAKPSDAALETLRRAEQLHKERATSRESQTTDGS